MLPTAQNTQHVCPPEERFPAFDQEVVRSALLGMYEAPSLHGVGEWRIRAADRIDHFHGMLELNFHSPQEIVDKRILILGCGSMASQEARANPGLWEPWFPRMCYHYGAKAIGLDLYAYRRGERFDYRNVDLSRSGSLSAFQSESFDIIQVSELFGSSDLQFRQGKSCEERRKMRDEIRSEVSRLLCPQGMIIEFEEKLTD